MQRTGQAVGNEPLVSPVGMDKIESMAPLNFITDAEYCVQPQQAFAATHDHVLAIVDRLPGLGIAGASRSAAKLSAGLDECDSFATVRQCHRCGDARHAATDDDDVCFARWA